jgi:hypothetical protein
MKSEPGFVILGRFHYKDMCFKVDHPHQFPNAIPTPILKPLHALWGPNEFIAAHVLSGMIQSIGSTWTSVPCESVTTLLGKCSRTIVARDYSGEVQRDPSGFLTSPSLLHGFALTIFDNFAMAGSVSTSLTYSWNLVFLACLMQFFKSLLCMYRSLVQIGETRPWMLTGFISVR